MNVATFFLFGMLHAAGWPRKGGLFGRKRVVDSLMLDTTVELLLQNAVAFGANRPELALRILSHSLGGRNWEQQGVDDLLGELVDGGWADPKATRAPWKVMAPARFTTTRSHSMPYDGLDDVRVQYVLTWAFIKCLVWGLLHPKPANRILDEQRNASQQSLPDAIRAGLDVDPASLDQTNDQLASFFEDIVRDFETTVEPLPQIADALKRHPRLGVRL